RNSPTISAPALVARARNSSRDSCALNSGILGVFESASAVVSRAACAAAVSELFTPLDPARERYSSPTRKACSLGTLLGARSRFDRCLLREILDCELLKRSSRP